MQKIISAHMSPKAQVTIPKEAREILGIDVSNRHVGFIIDPETHTVKLTRINITPVDEEFTDEELCKLIKLEQDHGHKTFKTAKNAIEFHKKLTAHKR